MGNPLTVGEKGFHQELHPKITRDLLKERVQKRLTQLGEILDRDNLFEQKVREAKFKDITVAEAVLIDKWLLLNDQPTQIVSHEERRNLQDLLPALTAELKRRGFTAQLETHRASIAVPPDPAPNGAPEDPAPAIEVKCKP